ncbi:MAG: secondary thiamine-phosphate synthase enzyme YjbQ [Promethearchaeota archaeon]
MDTQIILKKFTISTQPKNDVINITDKVEDALKETGLSDGIVCVFVAGSTAAISTLEYEPGLVKTDVPSLLEKLIPYDRDYSHHKTWGDHNGAGHLRSFLLKPDLTVPFSNKHLILGTWQQIVFLELDERRRTRTIYCQFLGK